jgi:hypothetical protein
MTNCILITDNDVIAWAPSYKDSTAEVGLSTIT